MKEYRIIEISDYGMDSESTLFLTNAPKKEIEKACALYMDGDNSGFKHLEERFKFKALLSTCEESRDTYRETRELFTVSEIYTT